MEFEIGKEYKSQVKVKVGPIWMKMRMDFVLDSPTTFHGRGSGAFNSYSFDNGTIEGNKFVYTTTIMGRETTSTVWISDDGTIEGVGGGDLGMTMDQIRFAVWLWRRTGGKTKK